MVVWLSSKEARSEIKIERKERVNEEKWKGKTSDSMTCRKQRTTPDFNITLFWPTQFRFKYLELSRHIRYGIFYIYVEIQNTKWWKTSQTPQKWMFIYLRNQLIKEETFSTWGNLITHCPESSPPHTLKSPSLVYIYNLYDNQNFPNN